MKRLVLITLFAGFVLTSCYQSRVIIGEQDVPRVKVRTKWNSSFFGGLIPLSTTLKVDNLKYNSYEIYTRHTILNMFVTGLTGGFYTPTTTTIYIGLDRIQPLPTIQPKQLIISDTTQN